MATILKNLSEYDMYAVPAADGMRFGIVVSEWNYDVTGAMARGAVETLTKHGAKDENIIVKHVPGSFELIAGCKAMARLAGVDAVIALGCVIKGDTPHFDYVCQGATHGIAQLNLDFDIPFIFGLLTTNDMQQALDRCGGRLGNKGTECAVTAIKMIDFIWSLQNK